MNALLTPEILVLFILESVVLIFSAISFYHSVAIAKKFDIDSVSSIQYALEKRSYLVSVIIKFSLILKLVIFIFFIYALDKLSSVITGAMCAAGVVSASDYGAPLFVLKLVNIYLFGFWIAMHYRDLKTRSYAYTKTKFSFYLFLFFLIAAEYALFILYIGQLDPAIVVSCCGVLFGSGTGSAISYLSLIPDTMLLALFYAMFLLVAALAFIKNEYARLIVSIFFTLVAVIAIINFFSTYVYELPSHRCPFCMLQKEYGYIGYLIYGLLFFGSFLAICGSFLNLFLKESVPYYRKALVLLVLFVVLVSYFPLKYYLKNGSFL